MFKRVMLWTIVLLAAHGCFRSPARKLSPPTKTPAESHAKMEATLAQIAQRANDENIFIGDGIARRLRTEIDQLSHSDPLLKRWLVSYQLAKAELLLGNEQASIDRFAEANALIASNPGQLKPEILRQFYFDIAIAYLRLAESENCCQQHTPNSCILPLQPDALHTRDHGARQAVLWLHQVLRITEPSDDAHLAAQWLLNLAHMTIGEYPHTVAPEHRIPNLSTATESDFPVFRNIAGEAGVATFSLAGGAIADDFDGDGHTDLIVSSFDPRESLRIFWNTGGGTFEDGTDASKTDKILGGLNLVQTDYNNDGLMDIFVMRGGWLGAAGRHPNSLLRNNGDRTFTDVTLMAGLAQASFPTQTAAWADFDLDGDLDLYVGNEHTSELSAPSQLFRNEGDGTFVDIAASAGVTNGRMAKAVAWGDYDNDRDPDLYVSNYRGLNRLFRNNGDGTFTDVAEQEGVAQPLASFPCWFFDANNDGMLDLFVSAYAGGIAEVAAWHLDKPFDRVATLPRLYLRSKDNTRFVESASAWTLDQPTHPMGANFGDLDNDGRADIYLGTGWPEFHELMPNVLYQNLGTHFEDVTNWSRVGHLQKGHAVAMADFDSDGDLDLFEQMGGFAPGDKFYDVLYQNPGNNQGWIQLKLVGSKSNRIAIGARIHVQIEIDGTVRSIYRWVNSGGSFGANPMRQHIGLGAAQGIRSIDVYWPATDSTTSVASAAINTAMEIHESP